jgi:hypothetical protein
MEEPFGVMPLEYVCLDIGKEVNSMLKSQDAINSTLKVSLKGVRSNRFYSGNGIGGSVDGADEAGGLVTVHSNVEDWHL